MPADVAKGGKSCGFPSPAGIQVLVSLEVAEMDEVPCAEPGGLLADEAVKYIRITIITQQSC